MKTGATMKLKVRNAVPDSGTYTVFALCDQGRHTAFTVSPSQPAPSDMGISVRHVSVPVTPSATQLKRLIGALNEGSLRLSDLHNLPQENGWSIVTLAGKTAKANGISPARLKALRKAAGLTQSRAAELVSLSLRSWQMFEARANGTPIPPGYLELFLLKIDPRVRQQVAAYLNQSAPRVRAADIQPL